MRSEEARTLKHKESKERWRGHHCCCCASRWDHQIPRPRKKGWTANPPPRKDLNYRPLPRPLAVVAAAVQVREDKKRERNKKRQIRRRVKGKEEALTAAAAGLAERGEKEKEVSVAAVVATTVRKKKPKEKKSSEAQFEENLTSKLLELGHLSTEDKEFILSMLDKLISAVERGEKEKEKEKADVNMAAAVEVVAAVEACQAAAVEVVAAAEKAAETKEEAEVTVAIAAAAAAEVADAEEEKELKKEAAVAAEREEKARKDRVAELHRAVDYEEAKFHAQWASERRDPEKFGCLQEAYAKRFSRLREFAEKGISREFAVQCEALKSMQQTNKTYRAFWDIQDPAIDAL